MSFFLRNRRAIGLGLGSRDRMSDRGQVLKLHCEEGWFNRRTHQLTKFQLRRQASFSLQSIHKTTSGLTLDVNLCSCKVNEDEIWSTFVYRGKWKWEYAQGLEALCPCSFRDVAEAGDSEERALHLYNKELPVVILLGPWCSKRQKVLRERHAPAKCQGGCRRLCEMARLCLRTIMFWWHSNRIQTLTHALMWCACSS